MLPLLVAITVSQPFVATPLEADPPVALACTPLPACAAKTLSTTTEHPSAVLAWDGKGLRSTNATLNTAAGYVDLATKRWVPLEAFDDFAEPKPHPLERRDDFRIITVLGHPRSHLAALGIGPDHVSTQGGFGAAFTRWRLIDLRRRVVLLTLEPHAGEILRVGPGDRVTLRRFHQLPPPDCHSSERAPSSSPRAGPGFAVEETWSVTTQRRIGARTLLRDDLEHGVTRLGACDAPTE